MPTRLDVPTIADVDRIAAHVDPVLRNLLITHCYHELARAVRARTGAEANWCSFATWASRQAGRTIRGEDLDEVLRTRLGASPEVRRLAAAVLLALRGIRPVDTLAGIVDTVARAIEAEGALDRAAAAVAAGNLKVFAEIARHFAAFLEASASGDQEAWQGFLAALRPGDPPDGQRLLAEAFQVYRDALGVEPGPDRAQLLHYANLLIGMHEQTRLQPQIAAAMNATIDEDAVRERVTRALLPGLWRTVRYRIAALFGRRPPLDDIVAALVAAARRELRHLITAHAMTLRFPADVTIRLGHGLTRGHAADLAAVTEPRLIELLARIDPAPDSPSGSGALDWSALDQRLHLIADLFRCYHDWEPLFDPPFTPAQLERLRAGTLPDPPH